MAITTDMFMIWRRPDAVFRRKIGPDSTEGGALAVVMTACGLMFVAQWPQLSRQAYLNGMSPEADTLPGLQALMGITFFALIFIAPLVFYLVALLSGLVLRIVGWQIPPLKSRLALFWALLATTPLMLFQGLLTGFSGPGPVIASVGMVILVAFLWLWGRLLRVAYSS